MSCKGIRELTDLRGYFCKTMNSRCLIVRPTAQCHALHRLKPLENHTAKFAVGKLVFDHFNLQKKITMRLTSIAPDQN
jgi:hypothetical protein